MNPLWSYFWPLFAGGLLVGGIAGSVAFRSRSRRTVALLIGGAVSLAWAVIWSGPLGESDRLRANVEQNAHQILDYYEMTKVTAHLHRAPLTRTMILTGPADDFQTSELVRVMDELPGVRSANWSNRSGGPPLIAEAGAAALLGFLVGLLLAYLIALRRRYNAQWNW